MGNFLDIIPLNYGNGPRKILINGNNCCKPIVLLHIVGAIYIGKTGKFSTRVHKHTREGGKYHNKPNWTQPIY